MTSCPKRQVDSGIWETVELAELFEKGLPPVSGGALDQAAWFVSSCRFLWAEQANLKAECKAFE